MSTPRSSASPVPVPALTRTGSAPIRRFRIARLPLPGRVVLTVVSKSS
ncbi:hypothetical protein [Conexibacter sp. DBS9H8]|nr:hypothetical protein [Conexibacter sp. DBS9H8]